MRGELNGAKCKSLKEARQLQKELMDKTGRDIRIKKLHGKVWRFWVGTQMQWLGM